ncbi:MAG: hypothetical protein RL885_22060 [Planctomycetota bacterium]
MGNRNQHSFAKRQREMEKRKKAEEKKARKDARKADREAGIEPEDDVIDHASLIADMDEEAPEATAEQDEKLEEEEQSAS